MLISTRRIKGGSKRLVRWLEVDTRFCANCRGKWTWIPGLLSRAIRFLALWIGEDQLGTRKVYRETVF